MLGARRLSLRRCVVQLLVTMVRGDRRCRSTRGVLAAPAVRAEPNALVDAAARHHCYELQIGFTHLGWNIWTGNRADLEQPSNDSARCSSADLLTLLEGPLTRHREASD